MESKVFRIRFSTKQESEISSPDSTDAVHRKGQISLARVRLRSLLKSQGLPPGLHGVVTFLNHRGACPRDLKQAAIKQAANRAMIGRDHPESWEGERVLPPKVAQEPGRLLQKPDAALSDRPLMGRRSATAQRW